MLEYAVVGSGVGGSCSALFLNKKGSCKVFEKESNLGGCSSTFKHKSGYFNAGATTFAGFEDGLVTYEFFKNYGVEFRSKPLDKALVVIHNEKRVDRYYDFENFLISLQNAYPHRKNREFYELITTINSEFYSQSGYYYQNSSLLKKTESLLSFRKLFFKFYHYLLKDAKSFIIEFFDDIDSEYLDYLDNQILIVTQTKLENTSFLNAALALGYQFQRSHYIYGGLGTIFEAISKRVDIVRKSEIKKIQKVEKRYILETDREVIESKNVILNSTPFDAPNLFEDSDIREHFLRYRHLDEGVSAFVLYIYLKKSGNFEHHYQIIINNTLPYTISNSIFVSFGDRFDAEMNRSVTISVHIKKREWDSEWDRKTQELQSEILKILDRSIGLTDEMI